MASSDRLLELNYDERGDVLYASLGAPQAALSYEIMEDVLLRYVPPNREVIGMTILNFSEHYPVPEEASLLSMAKSVVEELLRRYPLVPEPMEEDKDMPDEQESLRSVTIRENPASYLLVATTTAGCTATVSATYDFRGPLLISNPIIQVGQAITKDDSR